MLLNTPLLLVALAALATSKEGQAKDGVVEVAKLNEATSAFFRDSAQISAESGKGHHHKQHPHHHRKEGHGEGHRPPLKEVREAKDWINDIIRAPYETDVDDESALIDPQIGRDAIAKGRHAWQERSKDDLSWWTNSSEEVGDSDSSDNEAEDTDKRKRSTTDATYNLVLMEGRKANSRPRIWNMREDNLHLGNCHSIAWSTMGFPKGGSPEIKYIAFQGAPDTAAIHIYSSPDCSGDYYAISDGSMVLLEKADELRSWIVPK